MNAKRQNKKNSKRASKSAHQSKAQSHPRQERQKNKSAWKWLGACLAILIAGLLARWWLDAQQDKLVSEIITNVNSAEQAENWPEMERFAREWLVYAPTDAGPWEAAAQASLAMNKPDAAVGYLRGIPEPAPLDAYLRRSFLEMEALNQPLTSLKTCLETREHYPKDSETHERLLYIYTMLGQRNEITREAKYAIENGCDRPTTYAYLFSAKWMTFTNGFDVNQTWYSGNPEHAEDFEVGAVVHMPSYKQLDLLARADVEEGEEPRPLEYRAKQVAKLRERYPQNPELLAIELRDLCRAGETESVAERLKLVTQPMSEDNRFWRFKGWYHAATEQWPEAEAAYEKALELEPFDWATQHELANLKRRTQGLKASEKLQQKADFGKQLMMQVQKSKNLQRLEPNSLYSDLDMYFRLCGQPETANALQRCLKLANPN